MSSDLISDWYCIYHNANANQYHTKPQVHAFADRMYGEGKKPDPDLMLDNHALARSRWVTREELQKMFLEHVKEHQYSEVIKVGTFHRYLLFSIQ